MSDEMKFTLNLTEYCELKFCMEEIQKGVAIIENNALEQAERIERLSSKIERLKAERDTVKIQVSRDDEACEGGFACYLSPSLTEEGEGRVLLNITATFRAAADYPDDVVVKDVLIENIMHEVGHALEEHFALEFDEERIERITEAYRQKYNT